MAVFVADAGDLVPQRDARLGAAGRVQKGQRAAARAAAPFEPIGLNKPLTIRIAHVYTGAFPAKTLFGKKQDMLLTSAIKAQTVFDAAPRAINFHVPDVSRHRSLIAPGATEQGTSLIFHTPALVEPTLTLSLDLAFDSFPEDLIRKISSGLQSLAGFPIFAPLSGYLLIGSQLVNLAADAGRDFLEGGFDATFPETLDFDLPGYDPPEAAFRILTKPSFDVSDLQFVPKRGLVRRSEPAKAYDGDEPYIVLSLDGRPDPKLAAFTPTLASADLIRSFIGATKRGEAAIDMIVEAAKLANDAKYRLEADALEQDIAAAQKAGAKPADIAKLTERRDSLVKNIRSDLLKPAAASSEPPVADRSHDAAALRAPQRTANALARAAAAQPMASAQVQWRVARSLLKLREQINQRYPSRSKASDGTIGDAAHASRASDHNPWVVVDGMGVVTAMDITHDPANGCNARAIVDGLIAGRDRRIKYIIYDSQIFSSYEVDKKAPWTPRKYGGANKHTKHFHISVVSSVPTLDGDDPWSF